MEDPLGKWSCDQKVRKTLNKYNIHKTSEVLYFVSEDINSEAITALPELPSGFTPIKNNNPPIGLDNIRGNLFDPAKMVALPADIEGPDNDLNDNIQHYIHQAIQDQATVYAFGDRWGPETNKKINILVFYPVMAFMIFI